MYFFTRRVIALALQMDIPEALNGEIVGQSAYFTTVCGDDRGVMVRQIGGPKGKGLFATRPFRKGDTLFVERPYVAMQHLESEASARCCSLTFKFVGSMQEQLQMISETNCEFELPATLERLELPPAVPPPQGNAAEVFCSVEARDEAMAKYYQCLYSPDEDDPIHLFYAHAKSTNEAFLLAGKVVAKIVCDWLQHGNLEKAMEPVKMFQRQLWWEVVAMEGVPEDYTLEEYCKVSYPRNCTFCVDEFMCCNYQVFEEIATDSLDLLKQGIGARTNLSYCGGEKARLMSGAEVVEACQEVFTVDFYANIMGMFELNNIGML
jgi:hypothetical protein